MASILVVAASNQGMDAAAAIIAAAPLRRSLATALRDLRYRIGRRRRDGIKADRRHGRSGQAGRANEDCGKNVTHMVTPFGRWLLDLCREYIARFSFAGEDKRRAGERLRGRFFKVRYCGLEGAFAQRGSRRRPGKSFRPRARLTKEILIAPLCPSPACFASFDPLWRRRRRDSDSDGRGKYA